MTWQLIATRRLYRTKTMIRHVHFILEHEESIQHVGRHHDCTNGTSHNNALDAILTILYQQCSDMQQNVGQNIVQLSCVECCVKLLEFAHTSACVCVSWFCASDAHDFFAKWFINCRRSMRGRRVTATRELQLYTSVREFFVLGAPILAMLLATWWVRLPSMTGGVGNPTTVVK